MIYTVTFNPSLDYIVSVDDFRLGLTNRTSSELMLPGGKGINVSTVLNNLGLENTALGFIAGFTGEEIARRVNEMGIKADFIKISQGFSRINLKLKTIDGTEINGQGPAIPTEKLEELFSKLEQLEKGDVLILAGSIPSTISKDIYKTILKRLAGKEVLVVVDATGDLLKNVLEEKPFLVKPNIHELEEFFNVNFTGKEQVLPYAKELQEMGAKNVLVSMAGDGALFLSKEGDAYIADAPRGTLVNAVGAGDSMVAGFLAGWLKKETIGNEQDKKERYVHAFRMSVAAGSASAFSEYLATKEEIQKLYEICRIEKIYK